MDAAVDVFWRKGYTAASVQDVAERVGILKGSLYYYISSKDDLLFRILDDVHEQSRRILDDVVELDTTPLERLRTYMERHVKWCLENVEAVTVYFRDWGYLTGERLELMTKRRRGYDRVIRDLIRSAQDAGEVDRSIDPTYASSFLFAAVNHVSQSPTGAAPATHRPHRTGLRGPRGRHSGSHAVAGVLPSSRCRRRSKRASST